MLSKMASSPPDKSKTIKIERYNSYLRRVDSTKLLINASSKVLFRATLLIALALIFYFVLHYPPLSDAPGSHHLHATRRSFLISSEVWSPMRQETLICTP
ncbi:hypothetical protein I3843_02G051900 [Carya illinoinensis]|nr:hypothetical protein I3843_02G051900 [Carya illinoinensis]